MAQLQNQEQQEILNLNPDISPKFPSIMTSSNQNNIDNIDNQNKCNEQDRENWFPNVQNNINQKQEYQSKNEQEELKNLLDIFNKFDRKQNGIIEIQEIHNIFKQIHKENSEIDSIIKKNYIVKEGFISFDEFLSILAQVDQKQLENQNTLNYEPNPKILEFLKLLNDYRIKCETTSNYAEAKKAYQKIQEVMEKEQIRQKYNIRISQENELLEMETQQKSQFSAFTSAWDKFMYDYEQTAFNTLENLKEKHQSEYQDFIEKFKEEFIQKMRYSKHLIELRFKEKMQVKQKKYNEAESIKIKADELEQFEKQQKDIEIQEKIELKSIGLRKHQQSIFQALLKRIQTDRTKQLKQRQEDSQRNIRNDLIHKHQIEMKKALENVKEMMCQQLNIPHIQSLDSQRIQSNNLSFNSNYDNDYKNKRYIRSESYKPNQNQVKKQNFTRDYQIKSRKLSVRNKQSKDTQQNYKNNNSFNI